MQGQSSQYASKRFYFKRLERVVRRGPESSAFVETPPPEEVRDAVAECSLAKICSMLRVGPEFVDSLGFDLVLFKDCVEFYMEKCEPCHSSEPALELSLKRRIRALHKLHFVHKDIKPANILLSPSRRELVFCDFGISGFVRQPPGWRTLTAREGTREYMSPEMKSIWSRQVGWVDMYHNDMHALQITLAQLRSFFPFPFFAPRCRPSSVYPVEEVVRSAYSLWKGLPCAIPAANEYCAKLAAYFPELGGGEAPALLPLNPAFAVSCADKATELAELIHCCDCSDPVVQRLRGDLARLGVSQTDIKSLRAAAQSPFHAFPLRRLVTYEQQIRLFEKSEEHKDEQVENAASLMLETLDMLLESPAEHPRCQRLVNRLQSLSSQSPHLRSVETTFKQARFVYEAVCTEDPLGQPEGWEIPDELLLRASEVLQSSHPPGKFQFEKACVLLGAIRRKTLRVRAKVAHCYAKIGKL